MMLDAPIGVQNRGVHGIPEFLLEVAALGFGTTDIVLLYREGIGLSTLQNAFERVAQIAHAGRSGFFRIIGKDVEVRPTISSRTVRRSKLVAVFQYVFQDP